MTFAETYRQIHGIKPRTPDYSMKHAMPLPGWSITPMSEEGRRLRGMTPEQRRAARQNEKEFNTLMGYMFAVVALPFLISVLVAHGASIGIVLLCIVGAIVAVYVFVFIAALAIPLMIVVAVCSFILGLIFAIL